MKTFRLDNEEMVWITNVIFLMDNTHVAISCVIKNCQSVVIFNIDNGNYQIESDISMLGRSFPAYLSVSPFSQTFSLLTDAITLNLYDFFLPKTTLRCCLSKLDKSETLDVENIQTGLYNECKIPTEMIDKIVDEVGDDIIIKKIQTLKTTTKKKYKLSNGDTHYLDEKHMLLVVGNNIVIYKKN